MTNNEILNELKSDIEKLMTENEIVKSNAIKAMATKTGDEERSTLMFSTARKENQAYQNVLDIINGKIK